MLVPRPEGLYCPAGEFYIDPVEPVAQALVTHAHADHARAGHGTVVATRQTLDIMAIRYGDDFTESRRVADGEMHLGSCSVSFHAAGHVLGSAQIAIETGGRRTVVTGDYCRTDNPVCEPFEPVDCDYLITEATFGLPVFRHPDPAGEIARLLESLQSFPERAHIVGAYALGKAQRVIMLLREGGWQRPIYIHGALRRLCDYHLAEGIELGELIDATDDRLSPADFAGQIIIAPPSSFNTPWTRRFPEPMLAFASGWMQVRARARQRGVELPLVISDHVDWNQLTATIEELSPSETWITHGREDGLMRWCELHGHVAKPLYLIGYEDEPD